MFLLHILCLMAAWIFALKAKIKKCISSGSSLAPTKLVQVPKNIILQKQNNLQITLPSKIFMSWFFFWLVSFP